MSTRDAGRAGEEIAARYLARAGYELVARNYRTRFGEVDLIVRRGALLVFVEVKLRRGLGFGEPVESVTARKRRKIRRVAEHYLVREGAEFEELRFDVVGVLAGRDGRIRVRHVEGAF
ncbi:YraN family protein [Rubrobacter taiwanensis]|uniref:UPF0102 protein E0L93_07855 n=1 Tax=Rubrobacter taiwanensis TaxID=185139 RepID=A0A4R1BI88_9ACTN|nr:YraN family protein [Rubrobacter taiwanensis]